MRRIRGSVPSWGLLVCAAIAALTLLFPSQPTYDPWAWIVWGREITHLDLSTLYGPSWKPLPVAFTTVFSLFGGAAPALWVVVARTGALAGVLWAFRLGRRLGGSAASGVVAAVGLLMAPWYLRSTALATSEGLQVAFALAAIDQALEGRRLRSFWLGVGLALLRPECWPFLGLFGVWLCWRERRIIADVAVGLAALPVMWLLPERLGSGDWFRAAHRARDPISGTAADASEPFVAVLRQGWDMLSPPLRWAFLASLLVAVARRDRRTMGLSLLIAGWVFLVGVMTSHGFSGNQRYLVVPAAVAVVITAATLLRLAIECATRARGQPPNREAIGLAAVALATVFAIPYLDSSRRRLEAADRQARMINELPGVILSSDGSRAIRACGPVSTHAVFIPVVAWHLGVHLHQVSLLPDPHGTTMRVHVHPGVALPSLGPLAGQPVRTLGFSPNWRIVTTCGASP